MGLLQGYVSVFHVKNTGQILGGGGGAEPPPQI